MTGPVSPADALSRAAQRLTQQREVARAQSEELAQERQRAAQAASGEVPAPEQT